MSESQPLDDIRLEHDKVVQVVKLLCEGMGIRATARIVNCHRDTVLGVLETVGQKCASLLDTKIRNIKAQFVQADEIHTFVGCKAQRTILTDMERGDFFTYLSVDRDSKLIINWRVSKRDSENTLAFIQDLKGRMSGRFQFTTDSFRCYCDRNGAVRQTFNDSVDYATETKVFGRANLYTRLWRNPIVVIGIKRKARLGNPDMKMATTCHVERTNLSVRTFTRRFTRCTLGFSKKQENLRHAVALFISHFDFVRKHGAHGQTPAQAAGLTDHPWTVEELLQQASL